MFAIAVTVCYGRNLGSKRNNGVGIAVADSDLYMARVVARIVRPAKMVFLSDLAVLLNH